MGIAVEIYSKIIKGELKRFPNRFWVDPGAEENAKEITIYLIEEVLKWNEKDVKSKLTEMIFRKHKLSGMLEATFGRSPFKALDNAYPNKYKEWELKHVSKNLWTDGEKRKEAIEWLLDKVQKNSFEELTNMDFLENGLAGLLDALYKKEYFMDLDKNSVQFNKNYDERVLNVSFNKSGGTSGKGGITTRVTLPITWIRGLGVNEDDRKVIAKLDNDKIILMKCK